jgi:hypothetical protein
MEVYTVSEGEILCNGIWRNRLRIDPLNSCRGLLDGMIERIRRRSCITHSNDGDVVNV